MDLPEDLKSKNRDALEQWFLEGLEASPLPAAEMQAALVHLKTENEDALALEWAELMQEALQGPENVQAALDLLDLRHTWQSDTDAFRQSCKKACQAVLQGRPGAALIDAAGFGNKKAFTISECLKRMHTLTRLQPGALCYDKTWGFGCVSRLDHFYKKITVDFNSKPGHDMSFDYAAETLALIDDEHLLARRHHDPEGMAKMVQSEAGALVKITITSYGPLSAPLLKEKLVPDLLPEDDWKRFWDAARKDLKADPLVDLPAKRNDPIHLLDSEKAYDAAWFKTLGRNRDIQDIINHIVEFDRETSTRDMDDTEQEIMRNRIAFGIRGSQWQRPDRVASFLMTAQRYGFDLLAEGEVSGNAWRLDVASATRELLSPKRTATALAGLPAREIEPFISYIESADSESAPRLMLDIIPLLPLGPLTATLAMLAQRAGDACAVYLQSALRDRAVGAPLVYWVCSHLDQSTAWNLINMADLMVLAIDTLGSECMGENLKARNQLEILFADRTWLKTLFDDIDAIGRRDILRRLQNARGIDVSLRRAIMARVIKIYPELEHTLDSEQEAPTATRQHITSWRSYNRRREQLKELIETLIPQNSKEIAVARSYGDLSENHEYKAAKEHQGILLRRRGEIEQDLKIVRGADFEGFPTDKVGMGTTVEIERPSGLRQVYVVLGEWDRDEALNIISSNSRLAQLLEGHGAGEPVNLPALEGTGDAHETCTVISVTEPDSQVKTWIKA